MIDIFHYDLFKDYLTFPAFSQILPDNPLIIYLFLSVRLYPSPSHFAFFEVRIDNEIKFQIFVVYNYFIFLCNARIFVRNL
jgi:hypothetical protein